MSRPNIFSQATKNIKKERNSTALIAKTLGIFYKKLMPDAFIKIQSELGKAAGVYELTVIHPDLQKCPHATPRFYILAGNESYLGGCLIIETHALKSFHKAISKIEKMGIEQALRIITYDMHAPNMFQLIKDWDISVYDNPATQELLNYTQVLVAQKIIAGN